jgi:hypothetical protein
MAFLFGAKPGNKQSTTTKLLTDVITSVVSKSMQNCTSTTEASQLIEITDSSYVNITGNTMRQAFKVTTACVQSQEQNAAIQNEIITKLKSESAQTNQALLGAVNSLVGETNKTTVDSMIKTYLSNNVLTELQQNIVASMKSSQSIIVEGSSKVNVKKNSMDYSGELLLQTTQENVQKLDLIKKLEASTESKNAQVSENAIAGIIDAIGGVLNGLLALMGLPLLIFIACVILGIFLFRNNIRNAACAISSRGPLCVLLGNPNKKI